MRRFEFKDRRSYKFWEIEVEGTGYTARYGKVGTAGQTQTKSFATPDKAAAEAEKKIKEKVRKGYAEVSASSSVAPSETVDDPAADFAVRADRLQAAGDPWGERIALSIAHDAAKPKSPERRKLAKELDKLDKQHAEQLFGAALHGLMQESSFAKVARLTWEYGYVVRARVGQPDYDFDGPRAGDCLAALMTSPCSEFLRELIVGLMDFEGGGVSEAHAALAGGDVHEHLRRLFVGEFEAEEQEISWVDHGDVSGLYKTAPKLESLRLRGSGIELGKLEHPTLTRLEIESGGLPVGSVRSFAKAKLPELAHVSLWFGRTDYGGTLDIDALGPLWATKTLPKLQHLGLQNSEMQDEIAIALCKSKLLEQVSSVDMSMGTMRQPGAQAILDNVDRFRHLKSLNLAENFIPVDLCAALRRALGDVVKLGRQEQADVYDGEAYYYTSVGE